MSQTRRQIAEKVSIECSISLREARAILDEIFQHMAETIARGEDVKLSNFGSFKSHVSPERMGRNPKTGEPALVTARRRVTFKPSKHLLQKLETMRKD